MIHRLKRLELILFAIPATLGGWLAQLPLLETFVVWPDLSSHGIMVSAL
jgi:hypothetical protein